MSTFPDAVAATHEAARKHRAPNTPVDIILPVRAPEVQSQGQDMATGGFSANSGTDYRTRVRDRAESLRACIEAILMSRCRTPWELVVVDAGCQHSELRNWLQSLAAEGRILWISGDIPSGLTAAYNMGMSLHPDRDVVLLAGAARVHGDWLDRLRAHVLAHAMNGTASPLTNAASTAAYPRVMRNNEIPEFHDGASLDDTCARQNPLMSAPFALDGEHCTYISRHCIQDTGHLDAIRFPHGYQALTDFGRRASNRGFRHLLCGDVFVEMAPGHGQMPEATGEMLEQDRRRLAWSKLLENHPDQEQWMNMHASCTDAHFLRRRLDLARLQASARPRILAITHRQGGGVERHLQDMSRILREDVEILSLAQGGDDNMRLRWLRTGEEDFSLWYRMPEALPGLIELLRRLQIGRVHVHHVLEIPRCIMDLPDSLDLPWDFTVHDHYPICPQFNLGDEHGRYCGEKGSADCARCLSVRPAPWGLDIASWRALFAHWLRGAQRVFVPSMDTLERMRRYIPTANYLLLPHPEPAPSTTSLDLSDTQPGTNRSMALPRGFDPPWAKGRDRAYKVLLLGVMNPAKGLDLLGRCARDARERHLPLEYCVLGWFMNPLHGIEQLAVSCTGPYAYSDIQTLIAAERADVLMFPFQVPETWSYTLGEGLASGLPLIASALGAIPERLAGRPDAVLLSPEATGNQWNDAIMKLLESRT